MFEVQVSPISTAPDSSATLRIFCNSVCTSGKIRVVLVLHVGIALLVLARKTGLSCNFGIFNKRVHRIQAEAGDSRACTTSA
jgi:hypothetical protein